MSLVKRCQRQTLVYWAPGKANTNGEPTYLAPVQLTCRWDNRVQEIQTESGTVVVSRVELITESQLSVGGCVVYGSLSTVSHLANPKRNSGAYEVLKVSSTPPISRGDTFYEAWA